MATYHLLQSVLFHPADLVGEYLPASKEMFLLCRFIILWEFLFLTHLLCVLRHSIYWVITI